MAYYYDALGEEVQMRIKLSDPAAQEGIKTFISEARRCAQKSFGFASMLMAFSVALAVEEAIQYGKVRHTDKLIKEFARKIPDPNSWLLPPDDSKPQKAEIAEIMGQVRHALVHQISLPTNVELAANMEQAIQQQEKHPGRYVISTIDFVEAVHQTVQCMVRQYPDRILDPCWQSWTPTPRAPGVVRDSLGGGSIPFDPREYPKTSNPYSDRGSA